MTVPRTILRHRVERGSEAERLMEAAHRREVDRFCGFPNYPDSPRLARRGSSSGYSKSMAYERDDLIRKARTKPGYIGPEPDMDARVASMPSEVAAHLAKGGSAAAALEAAGVADAYAALGRVLDASRRHMPTARDIAVEIIEFGLDGAIMRASE